MNVAFVCWGPYQVYNAIRIASSGMIGTNNCYDIYIQNTCFLLGIKESLETSGLFRYVCVYKENTEGHSLKVRIARTIDYIFCHQALRNGDLSKIEHSYDSYDLVMASGWMPYFVELVNANPKASVFMYEDGAAIFIGDGRDKLHLSHTHFYRIMNTLFKKGPLSVKVEKLFVNNRSLANDKFSCPIIEIPKDKQTQQELLQQVFGNPVLEVYKGKKFIYLCQTRTAHSEPGYDDQKMCEPLNQISNKVIVRPHPKWPFNLEGFDVDNSGSMWELMINELNDVILIGEHSTAMFTPQMLYGKNFTLIFLYKIMCKNQMMVDELDKTVDIFRQTNNNIFTPESYDEYVNLISSLCQ